MAPPDLFMLRPQQITAYPYTRTRSCLQSTATLPSQQRHFYILREMGLQTEHHLSSTKQPAINKKQTKNRVTPLMKATDARPLVSP